MNREIKFRAFQDDQMLTQQFSGVYGAKRFFGRLYEDTELMQFTGLHDKNGKEIYEGDIVNYSIKKRFCKNDRCENELEQGISNFCSSCGTPIKDEDFITTAKVVYDKAAFGYRVEHQNDTYQQWPVYANEIYIAWVEIIGNIHEHPELTSQTK